MSAPTTRHPSKPKSAPKKAPPAPAPRPFKRAEVPKRLAAIEPAWTRADAKREASPERLLARLTQGDAASREDAARALGSSGNTLAIGALRNCLSDEAKAVRSAAAVSLARLGDRALIEEMVKGLADPSPRNVVGCAMALGLSRRPEAVDPLLKAFKTHDRAVGAAVAGALGLIGDRRATLALLEALKADFVPGDACDALGRLGDAVAAPALVKALRHKDGRTRSRAARALGALKDSLSGEPRVKAMAALKKLLEDDDRKLRLAAALSLHELGDREASAHVVRALSLGLTGRAPRH